ncbi:MAG: TetR/AcrR family transcriptional regulator [Marmoricola sp.]
MSSDVNPLPVRPDLRAARTARTEAAIVTAARSLFLEHGYVATTLADIALAAGVAARTVYVRFGTKAALFRRVIDEALVGDAEPVDVASRPRAQDAMSAPSLAERIDAFVEVSAGIHERVAALFAVAAQAEVVEPEIAEAATAGRDATLVMARTFWESARADGLVRAGVDLERLAITTDVLICADTTVHLGRVHAWTTARHASWLRESLSALASSA